MRFKLDENVHSDAVELFRRHGHDAMTVHEQGLSGEADSDIAGVCRREERAIVTFDLDFSDVLQYPPEYYSGIIVLRLNNQGRATALDVLERIIPMFDAEAPARRLWIVDELKVRVRGDDQ